MPGLRYRRLAARAALVSLAILLTACGGGGNPTDVRPGQEPPPPLAGEPNSFLLFPNPQRQPDGALQTDTLEYAEAYYRAIDPANARDTFAKFKAVNGFGTGTGTEVSVVFGDLRDLGYGRAMTGRQNPDGTLVFFVENYLIEAGAAYGYSPLNLEAAIVRDTRWIAGVSGIEFSPGPAGGPSFVKFYNFSADGSRQLAVSIDGRGEKAMPGPCITCHGGRGDPLTPPDASGKRHFPLVPESASRHRGDTQARLPPIEPDIFDYSTRPGYTRADQEAALKAINRMILCSYPLPATSSHAEDSCRRIAGASEWQGTAAADVIKSGYGGNGLPNPSYVDAVPAAWRASGQEALYREVVGPSCRSCHILRGVRAQSDLDFATYEKFVGFADRTRAHVLDRANMPLAKIIYDAFWEHPTRPGILAGFLESRGLPSRDAAGAVLRPGRPIADPGPDRVAVPGAVPLSGENSLFATGYAWSLVSGPAGATLAGADAVRATLTAAQPGTYVVQLVASNGAARSAPVQLRIVINAALSPAPAAIRFTDIKSVMQTGGACTACHSPTGFAPRPPAYFSNTDRNGDGVAGDATDDAWFYEEVRGLINFTEIAASPLLRKPSGSHHGGGAVGGFSVAAAPGEAARVRYDLFLNWILNGAPR